MARKMTPAPFTRPLPRTVISIKGAREHNLKNISLDIPRDQLVVITGLSGSGKSSLAFDTIYAEGQRRYMESLSSFAKRFIAQVAKPDVDFMFGLSPVISIEQKTVGKNPRSTVGTMTDINGYLNLLFATAGQAHCPYCQAPVPIRTRTQILDLITALPKGTAIELRAPVFKVYAEDFNFLASQVRKSGYRKMLINGKPVDISQDQEIDLTDNDELEVIVDTFIIGAGNEPGLDKQLLTGISNALVLGDQYLKLHITLPAGKTDKNASQAFYQNYGCPRHHLAVGDLGPGHFVFNDPLSACRTCMGLGTYMQVHPDLLVPDKTRSIKAGCFVSAAFNYQPDNWDGRTMYSLSQHYKFSLDTPFEKLHPKIVDILLNGTGAEKFELKLPPDAKNKDQKHIGKLWGFDGIARRIERTYKRYRQKQVSHGMMEAWLEKVMVEHRCPDCTGTRLRKTRLNFKIQGKSIHEVGEINFAQLSTFLDQIKPSGQQKTASQQILKEVRTRLDLLLGIGLDYLNFNRKSSTLSGGESQRIRLSTQIGSGLMGMLYVLDEPSIGLHPKDNVKMIATLRRLRDLGNTVIVVEHDEDTIKAADHVIEMGPGPGVHGGHVVAQGTLKDIIAAKNSPTGDYFSGRKEITTPNIRHPGDGNKLTIKGARENNLKNLTVDIPLRQLVCVTGASGSGKSTLINDILYKRLYKELFDTRVLPGNHDSVEGIKHITNVIDIDQSPIGRTPHSNPATYIGFYDDIRNLFARTPEARKRGYNPGRFSFNVKTGRCAECSGEGVITTALYFMPDVEVRCESCKGARYNAQTLEVTYKDKTISDVLNMPVEVGAEFFADIPSISKKLRVMDELGLGYLTLGQSATTLSGGEAQRIKLATELSKLRRGEHVFYILDEPTTGLHLADVARLLECLKRLVSSGHSVLVIEHHLDVIKSADHVIDLGPQGGHSGGQIIATGTPEEIAKVKASHTGRFLAPRL